MKTTISIMKKRNQIDVSLSKQNGFFIILVDGYPMFINIALRSNTLHPTMSRQHRAVRLMTISTFCNNFKLTFMGLLVTIFECYLLLALSRFC